jgi:hypothetical protein
LSFCISFGWLVWYTLRVAIWPILKILQFLFFYYKDHTLHSFFLRYPLTNHPIWLNNWILRSISPLVTTGGVTGTQLDWKLHPLDHHTTQLHTLTTMTTLQILNNLNNYINYTIHMHIAGQLHLTPFWCRYTHKPLSSDTWHMQLLGWSCCHVTCQSSLQLSEYLTPLM